MLEVLTSMQTIQLHALPEDGDQPWEIDEFCDQIDEICRASAAELHKKCMMVEEAVEEILLLVKRARIDNSDSVDQENNFLLAGIDFFVGCQI